MISLLRPRGLLSSAMLLALTVPVAAQDIDGSDPARMADLLRAAGHPAELGTDNYGDPRIDSRFNETEWALIFYDCDDGRDCTFVQFTTSYILEEGASLGLVNSWNEDTVFGRAFVDEDENVAIDMAVNLEAGVSAANFADTVDWWRVVLEQFEAHIEW